ncbi:MAG: hypothetical protein ACKO3F_06230 [Cyanobium sp.]
MELRNSQRDDSVYTVNPRQINRLEQAGYRNQGTVFTADSEPLRGLDPVWQLVSPEGQHATTASRQERRHWLEQGWRNEGVAFYSVAFPNAALTSGWEA